MDSTLDALYEVGADQLSLPHITERRGVTPPAIYEYFEGKDQILRGARRGCAPDAPPQSQVAVCWTAARSLMNGAMWVSMSERCAGWSR